MADVNVSVYDAKRVNNGVNVTDNKTAATSGNTYLIENNGDVKLLVTSVAGCTVTVVTQQTVDGLDVTDYTAIVPANKQVMIGPFPPNIYNNSLAKLSVTVSAAADIFAVRG